MEYYTMANHKRPYTDPLEQQVRQYIRAKKSLDKFFSIAYKIGHDTKVIKQPFSQLERELLHEEKGWTQLEAKKKDETGRRTQVQLFWKPRASNGKVNEVFWKTFNKDEIVGRYVDQAYNTYLLVAGQEYDKEPQPTYQGLDLSIRHELGELRTQLDNDSVRLLGMELGTDKQREAVDLFDEGAKRHLRYRG